MLEYLSLYHRVIVTKTIWYQHRNRHVVQWSKLESSSMHANDYSHLIFDRDAKTTYWQKENIQQMMLGKLYIYIKVET